MTRNPRVIAALFPPSFLPLLLARHEPFQRVSRGQPGLHGRARGLVSAASHCPASTSFSPLCSPHQNQDGASRHCSRTGAARKRASPTMVERRGISNHQAMRAAPSRATPAIGADAHLASLAPLSSCLRVGDMGIAWGMLDGGTNDEMTNCTAW